jgi:hypothetical protein
MVMPADRFDPVDAPQRSADPSDVARPRSPYRPRGADMSANTVTTEGRAANRANSETSTGPRTRDGKARAARNATSHGIFCQSLLLPGEDEALLHDIRQSIIDRLRPQDALELMLVDRIVQAQWRLSRCQSAERQEHLEQAQRVRGRARCDVDEMLHRDSIETRRARIDKPHRSDARVLAEFDRIERVANTEAFDPGFTLRTGLQGARKTSTFERLGSYEQRLERTMHRALLELRQLRGKEAKAWEDLPASPYAEEDGDGDDAAGDENATPSPRVCLRGEGGGEGQGACGDEVRSMMETALDETSEATAASDRTSTPDAARPSPQPSPRSTGEREPELHAPVKNEPASAVTHLTASAGENSLVEPVGDVAVATSSVPAGNSGATSENDATPDALVLTETAPISVLPPPAKISM